MRLTHVATLIEQNCTVVIRHADDDGIVVIEGENDVARCTHCQETGPYPEPKTPEPEPEP